MALGKFKTEMTGTGGGRWTPRAEAKTGSATVRRRNGRSAIAEGLAEAEFEAEEACEPGCLCFLED